MEAIAKKHEFQYILRIADGARVLWQFFYKKYPDVIHVVDFFHFWEHLWKLRELFFKDPSDTKVWYKKHRAIPKEDPNSAPNVIRAVR